MNDLKLEYQTKAPSSVIVYMADTGPTREERGPRKKLSSTLSAKKVKKLFIHVFRSIN